uniref:Ig-like domain-containing protein n=1 Tax=Gopherus evgoodei TaxID=1825980 RepID=A0A8C4WQI2_9SAUR
MDPVGPCCNSPLALDVSLSDWLILQVPYYGVFEGDPLCLRCYGWKGARVSGIRYYRDGADVTPSHVNSELSIKQARTRDSGKYHCTGSMKTGIMVTKVNSPTVSISVQELFSTPVLRAAGSGDPIEGSSVTLSCVTQLNPQKLDTPLQRFFYKDSRALGEPRSSPDYHIPVAGLQDSGSYHCEVQTVTSSVWKQSPKLKIAVKRIPASQVSLEVQPLGGQVTEGEWLMLNCSVSMGTGPITFSWHREGARQAMRTETRSSQRMVYEIPAATETDTGEYYCMASNGNAPAPSPRVKVAVKVPVSPPHLTISAAGSWAAIGDVVVIQCESPRGSAPILYQFHHEGATLGNRTVSSRGPGSLALNVTSERDSGTYSCEADNGMASGPQHSDPFHLSVLGMPSPHALLEIGGAGSVPLDWGDGGTSCGGDCGEWDMAAPCLPRVGAPPCSVPGTSVWWAGWTPCCSLGCGTLPSIPPSCKGAPLGEQGPDIAAS